MKRTPPVAGTREFEQIREHYHVEKELAAKLRHASARERRSLYTVVYDELFRRVPDHPNLTKKASPQETRRSVERQLRLLARFLTAPNLTFLEVGPGDCALSLAVAKYARDVYMVDVSEILSRREDFPKNVHLVITDGSSIPVDPNLIDVAYSHQLIEHLHPEDARLQLENIFASLREGGAYVCITPNRLNGPHDISKFFDTCATGFHLKEYTVRELSRLFREVGFSKAVVYGGGWGWFFPLPPGLVGFCEWVLDLLPYRLRKALALSLPGRALLGIRLVGFKSQVRREQNEPTCPGDLKRA